MKRLFLFCSFNWMLRTPQFSLFKRSHYSLSENNWGHLVCHWLSHFNPDLVTQMNDISNQQCQILVMHFFIAKTSIEFLVAANFNKCQKSLRRQSSQNCKAVLRDDPCQAYLETLKKQTSQGIAHYWASVWVWTMSGWYIKVGELHILTLQRAHFGVLSILFWRGQKCFWSAQRSLKEPSANTLTNPSVTPDCVNILKLCKHQDLNTQICSQQSSS